MQGQARTVLNGWVYAVWLQLVCCLWQGFGYVSKVMLGCKQPGYDTQGKAKYAACGKANVMQNKGCHLDAFLTEKFQSQ